MAGARRPPGRRSQMRGCIRTTVHDGLMATAASSAPTDAQTVATLRSEEDVDGVFACTRKERHISRAGTPYLTIGLGDNTGAILARAVPGAGTLARRFRR